MAEIDLCKLGYQDDALNALIQQSHESAKKNIGAKIHYFYGSDGNTQIIEDGYGDAMWPVPVEKVLAAIKASHPPGNYRRTDWALALLDAMTKDPEQLEVMFYGH